MTPRVSVLVPCYNEATDIGDLLAGLRDQDFPLPDLEVLVADAMSQDGTRSVIEEFRVRNPGLKIHVIDNLQRSIPAALNLAFSRSVGEMVIRLDAHSVPESDYVSRCLQALEETGAANAGGLWRILPAGNGWIARSIAAAGAHPLGAGDARYRTSGAAGPVETVPFGAFPRSWLTRMGGYDESLHSNEDYELNHRLRSAGGTIWFDPRIRSSYRARADLVALSRQYSRYGFWKARMLRRHPDSIRWRQVLPPLFVASLGVLGLASLWSATALWVLGVESLVYLAVVGGAGVVRAIRSRDAGLVFGFPLAVLTMHGSWGLGFIAGAVSGWTRRSA
ncbi:MAG: glycosyltransferase family 2 protein [Anaerolineales bacterium]